MADVFISYSKGQADNIAQQIADTLNRAGISCWYMGRDSRHGRYPGKITQAIRECFVFVLILNHKSNKSKDVLSEVNIAFKYDREIIPFHIDDCEMSDDLFYHLSPFTTINANPPDEQRIQELVQEISDILGREPPQTEPAPTLKLEPPPAKIIKSGKCGDSVTYTLENGVLTISGVGDMWDFTWNYKAHVRETPWWNERETISHVEIQDGVTSVGHGAFADCEGITSVTIPNSIITIKYKAFSGCKKLKSVIIPDSVMGIGNKAFSYCTTLTSVTIPDSVTFIGVEAFYNCWSLATASIPANLQIVYNTFPLQTHIERREKPNTTDT